jgi:hypothetical protein
MKVSYRFLLRNRKYIPFPILLKVIVMSGLSAMKSKLKYLGSVTIGKIKGRQQSVVFMNAEGEIQWPDNPNEKGVLVAPRRCSSVDEWYSLIRKNQSF